MKITLPKMKQFIFLKSARTKTETWGGRPTAVGRWPIGHRPMAHRPMAHRQTHSRSQKLQKNQDFSICSIWSPKVSGRFLWVRKHIYALFQSQSINKIEHFNAFLGSKTKNAHDIDQFWSKLRFDRLKIRIF